MNARGIKNQQYNIENKVHSAIVGDQISAGKLRVKKILFFHSYEESWKSPFVRSQTDKKINLKGKRDIAGWNDDYMSYLLGLAADPYP